MELGFIGLVKRRSNISLQLYKWQLKADRPHSSLQKLVMKQAVIDLSCSLGGLKVDIRKRYAHQEGNAVKQVIHRAAGISDFGSFQDFFTQNHG